MSRLTRGLASPLPVRGYHPLWPDFPDGSGLTLQATGLVRVRSPLLTEFRLISFPLATEMFHFARFAPFRVPLTGGFPHSDIHGSKLVRSSPWLFAAYHVLHRLSTPRHPPNALIALDYSHYRCPCARHERTRSAPIRKRPVLSRDLSALSWSRHEGRGALFIEQTFSSRCQENRPSTGRLMANLLLLGGQVPIRDGGARRDRTDDLMLAKHALSQLSYGPVFSDDHRRRGGPG